MSKFWPVALGALALAFPPLVHAEPFALMTYERPADFAARADIAKAADYWDRWNAVAAEMAQAGVLRGGSALKPEAQRIGAGQVAPGPALSGFFTLEVADREAALGWARKLQAAGAAAVEVRALQANPAMR